VTLLLRRLLGLLGLIGKPIDTGGGGGGGGGGSGGSGGGGITVETDGKIPKVLPQAVVEAIAKCACCPGGSGVPFPNGCLPCDCRPCICYWYTDWHKSITVSSFLHTYGGGVWTLVSQTLTRVGGDPDYMYLGVTDPVACQISGLFAIDGNNDLTDNVTFTPRWSGEMVYTNGVDTVTFDVVFALSFQINLGCDEPAILADSAVWNGPESAVPDIPGYTFNGSSISNGGPPQGVDIGLPNDISPGDGTITNGSGTLSMGYNFPALTITAMRQPGCVG
jgi:hypothetical protein